MRTLTLTTDFGAQDWFVGTMKGVILNVNPSATVVDITHGIPAGDIRAGAFALRAACRYFPKGSVHVAVVDPGVGSARRAIAVRTADYFFVGPDNGVLSFALMRERIESIRRLENETYFLHPLSATFHGRDVFAPVAAHLSRGLPLARLGPAQQKFVRLPWRRPKAGDDRVEGEVVYVDRFGNAITNIAMPRGHSKGSCEVFARRRRVCPVKSHYQSVPAGHAVAVPGSSGLLEICINGGSASELLKLKAGDPVSVVLR